MHRPKLDERPRVAAALRVQLWRVPDVQLARRALAQATSPSLQASEEAPLPHMAGEPQLAELPSGDVLAWVRVFLGVPECAKEGRCSGFARSTDGGATFGELEYAPPGLTPVSV